MRADGVLVNDGNRRMRKKLLAGAVAGGVLLGVWAMIDGVGRETLRGSVEERQLKAVALTLPVVYDAKLVTSVSAQVTVHDKDVVPLLNQVPGLRDWRNHTLTDTAEVIVNVGIREHILRRRESHRAGNGKGLRLARRQH
jgi:hypothetical protein